MYAHEARLRAGSAAVDITPDHPVVMSGYGARDGRSTGVHDRLFTTALILDDGAVTVCIASVDALNVSREFTHRVTAALSSRGVELDAIILAGTHTHAGPYLPARAIDVSPPLRADEDVSRTVEGIESDLVGAIERAFERRESAGIRLGHATEEGAQENRRAAGGVGGNVRMPQGPIDPDVTAVVVETASGDETILYNFACHPVCTTPGETVLSADWPGYARRRIEADRDGATVLFLNGAAGDINPSGLEPARSGSAVYEAMERVGSRIGDAVLRAVADATADDAPVLERTPIRCANRAVEFPVKRTPSLERIESRLDELEAQLEYLEEREDGVGYEKVNWDRRYAEELAAIAKWDVDALPNAIPYVEIGDLGVLGMPGEIHARHGLEFKERSRADTLVLAGYANDYVGYVPTLSALENGGYEVRTMKIAPEAIVEFRRAAFDLVSGDTRW
ncbi:neutral/alkaline non-lysosomal ceramidase N-terminal domain-containing protein [Natrialbaceae archaeon A-CW1-1]